MLSEKNVRQRSYVAQWGYGVSILLVLIVGFVGCSGSDKEIAQPYSSEEVLPDKNADQVASLAPGESANVSSQQLTPETKSLASSSSAERPSFYSSEDRAVVLQYAEQGGSDAENTAHALRLVKRARQYSASERMMEDYLVLAAHFKLKGEMNQVVQYANQGIMAKSDSSRVKAQMFIYLGYTYEGKSQAMARSYFKQAAKIDPDFYKGRYELGRIAYLQKKFPAAQAQLKKSLELNPDNAEVYGMLGQMFYGMDHYEDAVESFKKALALSPQTHWILIKLGDAYFYGLKEREKGGQFYQQAVAKSGSDPEAHFGLALYHRSKNNYGGAEEELQKAFALDHKNPKYQRELKDMRSEKTEMAERLEKHALAIADNPENPRYAARLGRFYLRWQKYDQAEEQFKQALELAAKLPNALEAAEDSEDSGETVIPAASAVPEYASNLGWFYFNDKKSAKAEEAFQSALKVDPKYIEALFGLGRTFEYQKQYELADFQYNKTLASDPKHKEAQERRAALKKAGHLMPVDEADSKPMAATDPQAIDKVIK